jgi:hypothetical protein
MATRLRIVDDDPEGTAADWLTSADDRYLACRGAGHAFPKLRAGRGGKLPRGLRATPQHDGAYQLVMTCRDCGTERTLTTLPGGELDLPARYTYRHPEGYKTPKGAGEYVTRRACLAESWRRAREAMAAEAAQDASTHTEGHTA